MNKILRSHICHVIYVILCPVTKKIQTLIHQAEPLGSSPEAEDNAEVKRKQSAEEVGHFVGFRGIFDIR